MKGRGGTDPTSCGPFASRIGLGERKSSSSDSDLRKSFWSVEGLNNARTLLADCFSILLEGCKELKPWTRATINDHSLQEHHRWSDPQPAVAIARAVDHISQLAQVYAGQGKYKYVEAEPVYLQGLKVCQTVHGEFHADVAATLNYLRVIHRVYGQYAKAEPLLRGLWPSKRNSFGPRPSGRGLSVVNLAQLRVVQRQPENPEPLYRRTLAIRKRALGCPTRGREDAGGPCQCSAENRACRRGDLAGAACQNLSREAELNVQRHSV